MASLMTAATTTVVRRAAHLVRPQCVWRACSGESAFAGTGIAEPGLGVSLKGRTRFYKTVSVEERAYIEHITDDTHL